MKTRKFFISVNSLHFKNLNLYYMSDLELCHDLTRKRVECLDSPPVKGCVEEGMGGHPGAFTDIQLPGCSIACGKKITGDSQTELAFYDDLYRVTGLPDYL